MKVLAHVVLFLMTFVLPGDYAAFAQAVDPGSQTQVTQDCYQAHEGGYNFSYCAHRVSPSTNTDVVYYLHGAYGSAHEWATSPYFQQIYDTWGVRAPIVISVSYGQIWLLAEKNVSRYSGLYENFVDQAMPSIEKALDLHPAHRMLIGASMGGFNASQLYLKNPNLFTKVALLCPAIATVSPFAPRAEVDAYIARTHALRSRVNDSITLSKMFFPNATAWQKGDTLALAQAQIQPAHPQLFVSAGMQDEYGFFEGAQKMVEVAKSRGARANWNPVQGGHCSWDWQLTSAFLVGP